MVGIYRCHLYLGQTGFTAQNLRFIRTYFTVNMFSIGGDMLTTKPRVPVLCSIMVFKASHCHGVAYVPLNGLTNTQQVRLAKAFQANQNILVTVTRAAIYVVSVRP